MQIKCHHMVDQKYTLCDHNKKLLYVLPNEVINFEGDTIVKEKDILVKSEARVPIVCPIFERCGGCDYLHMSYPHQVELKDTYVKKCFSDVNVLKYEPMMFNPSPLNYRHKVVLSATTVKNKLKLGLYREGTKEVIPYLDCHIQDQFLNEMMKTSEQVLNQYKIPAYDIDKETGIIKHILLRKSYETHDVMMGIITHGALLPNHKKIISDIVSKHPEIKTVVQNIHRKKTKLVLLDEEKVLYGTGYIMDQIGSLKFRLSLKSFYQVNPMQMMKLYQKALEMAEIKKDDVILDCYSGIGTLSLLAGLKSRDVTGIEINDKAHRDAVSNAKINLAQHVRFVHQDVKDFMRNEKRSIDVLMMDPTRDGADDAFISSVLALKPKRVLYISCHPITQVRDIKKLQKMYQVKKVLPVDMFSQTVHVENIALLELKRP